MKTFSLEPSNWNGTSRLCSVAHLFERQSVLREYEILAELSINRWDGWIWN
jgi:hypothetical protein